MSIISRLVQFNKTFDRDLAACLRQEDEWKKKHGRSSADLEARRQRLNEQRQIHDSLKKMLIELNFSANDMQLRRFLNDIHSWYETAMLAAADSADVLAAK